MSRFVRVQSAGAFGHGVESARMRAARPRVDMSARLVSAVIRLGGAALLGIMAGIHFHLYYLGYRSVPTIGPLFYLNGVLGIIAGAVLLVAPRRLLAAACLLGGMLEAGTLGALLLSLTVGIFGFSETTDAPLVSLTLASESAGALLLLAAAVGYGLPQLRAWRAGRSGRSAGRHG